MRTLIIFLAAILMGLPSFSQQTITEKTLVVWASPNNLEQQGGSALTIDDGSGHFDGIVFGEIEKGKWMAGSNNFLRTEKDQSEWLKENSKQGDFIQIAIVYKDNSISIYRNGEVYAFYDIQSLQSFNPQSASVLFGRRHLDAGDPGNSFEGRIKEARIYSYALSKEQVKQLRRGTPGNIPEPWIWWDFENKGLQDVTGHLKNFSTTGNARLDNGELILEGNGDTFIAWGDKPGFEWDELRAVPDDIIRNTRSFRERLIQDPYRPAYHFCIAEGRGQPGDPNGAFFHDGKYHLMYLYNREEVGFCWGHISSTDLLHWRHHPDAIGPGKGDEGCFSGGAFMDKDGSAYLTYWMLWGDKGIGIAQSSDDFNKWVKFEENPVIRSTEWGLTEMKDADGNDITVGSADPSNIWIEDGKYYMLTGNLLVLNKLGRNEDSPEDEKGDRLYLWESQDLIKWDYLHRFYESDRKWTDASEDNMCPSFIPLPSSPSGGPASNKHLLLFISHNKGCQYYIGDYMNDRFFPEKHGRMTWVDNEYFAPEALVDESGRQIMWSWIFDGRPDSLKNIYGWTGTYGLPRSLWLNDDGSLGIRPVEEIKTLRMHEKALSDIELKKDEEIRIDSAGTELMELELIIEHTNAKSFKIDVCASEDGREKTTIIFDSDNGKLEVDTRKSSLKYGKKVVESAPFELKNGEPLKLRIFTDRSIVEVYANDRQAIARRIYPTLGGTGIRLVAKGGTGKLISLKRWEMAPSNPY